jgi:hypothetical protein
MPLLLTIFLIAATICSNNPVGFLDHNAISEAKRHGG